MFSRIPNIQIKQILRSQFSGGLITANLALEIPFQPFKRSCAGLLASLCSRHHTRGDKYFQCVRALGRCRFFPLGLCWCSGERGTIHLPWSSDAFKIHSVCGVVGTEGKRGQVALYKDGEERWGVVTEVGGGGVAGQSPKPSQNHPTAHTRALCFVLLSGIALLLDFVLLSDSVIFLCFQSCFLWPPYTHSKYSKSKHVFIWRFS